MRFLRSLLPFALSGGLLRQEEGAVALEFALSVALQCALIFGVLEASLGIYAFHFSAEAAREASRYASVRGSSCVGFPSACPAQASDIQAFVQGLTYPGLSSSSISAQTTWAAFPAGTTCSPSASCNNPGNLVTVTVQYSFPFSAPLLPSNTWTLRSTSAMVISQ